MAGIIAYRLRHPPDWIGVHGAVHQHPAHAKRKAVLDTPRRHPRMADYSFAAGGAPFGSIPPADSA
ncbi:MAG: hypothetical protein Q4G65_17315, partial [bacterium]|nr:hypothetical protein [bacterium]